jgi:hypothetical protein
MLFMVFLVCRLAAGLLAAGAGQAGVAGTLSPARSYVKEGGSKYP